MHIVTTQTKENNTDNNKETIETPLVTLLK